MDSKIFSFSNLKGGAGKSKLNAYFANYLDHLGFKVILVDFDVSQHTTLVYDQADNMTLEVVQFIAKHGNIADYVKALMGSYDYIIVDIPGTIQQEDVMTVISMMDYVVIPSSVNDDDLQSTSKFARLLKRIGVPFNIMLNKYEAQYFGMGEEEKNEFNSYNKMLEGMVLTKGIRFERSLLQENFVLGEYGKHKNAKRVEPTVELVLKNLNAVED
jgi:cellulose biosynthesis protein BcsQ